MMNYASLDRHKLDHNLHSFIHRPPIYLGTGRSNKCLNVLKVEKSNIYEFGWKQKLNIYIYNIYICPSLLFHIRVYTIYIYICLSLLFHIYTIYICPSLLFHIYTIYIYAPHCCSIYIQYIYAPHCCSIYIQYIYIYAPHCCSIYILTFPKKQIFASIEQWGSRRSML